MQLTDTKKKELTQKLLFSRLRILNDHAFYGMLLMNMKFSLDPDCPTAYTNAYKIAFSPTFLDELSPREVDFVLMHEILHVVLKHCFRGLKYDQFIFNIACDIVVNSNILKSVDMDLSFITLKNYGEAMHIAPDGAEGYNYTAEEVYEMLIKKAKKMAGAGLGSKGTGQDSIGTGNGAKGIGGKGNGDNGAIGQGTSFDDHSHWQEDEALKDEWEERLVGAIEASSHGKGEIPLGAKRLFGELTKSQLDWRVILKDFVSYEKNDYSFTPPDRRYDSPFFLPDFNEEVEVPDANLLFVVDTSGSISDLDLNKAFSEIRGAIADMEKLHGFVVCMDATTYEPMPFESVDDILSMKVQGGGGTSFKSVFQNLDNIIEKMKATPDMIVFITDGYDVFPDESLRRNIPVLWIINNDEVTPPWGAVARIK